MDCLWTAKREDNSPRVTVTVAWMKDGDEEGYQWTSELVAVPLGEAKDGSAPRKLRNEHRGECEQARGGCQAKDGKAGEG